jgi:hypothetical protein
MTHEPKDFSRIPASACTLIVGEFELGDNGEKAKTAPVRLVARSGKPIEHWFWGRIVHDLAGMHLHKSRIPIDYVHDSKEVVGYLNRFDIQSGDLVTSGALVPYKDTDRATEIIYKHGQGVPYEASINFGGDGIKIEEVPEGFVSQVNGFTFEGPGVIVREWPLRGVAICPYGADMHTESAVLSSAKQYAATVFRSPETAAKETDKMKQESPVEVAAPAEKPVVAEAQKIETPVETTKAEGSPVATPVEAAQAEGEKSASDQEESEPKAEVKENQKPELSRNEFLQIVDEFGAEIAAQIVKDGGSYISALKLAYSKRGETLTALEKQCSEMKSAKVGRPVPVVDASKQEKSLLFKTGK